MLDLPVGTARAYWAPRSAARDEWQALLDPGERARRGAYLHPEDRDRFLVGAVLVRLVFARELSIEPAMVRLDRSCPDCERPHGKVRLAAGQSAAGGRLEVSISHSGGWVVLAACRSGAVGVDVEQITPAIDHLGVARIAFTDSESQDLSRRPPEARPAAFTRYWTRKEAVAKAVGEGLRAPLSSIEVTAPGRSPAVLSWRSRPDLAGMVQLHDLIADDKHRASLAVISPTPVCVVEEDAVELFGAL